jgi:hypothetical protein
VAVLTPPVFEEELPHEAESMESRDNANAVKQKVLFIKVLHNKFQIVNEPIGRFAMLSSLPRLRFVRAETN